MDILALGFHVCAVPEGTCNVCGQVWIQLAEDLFVSGEPGSKIFQELLPPAESRHPEVDPQWLREHSSQVMRKMKKMADGLGVGSSMGAAGGSAASGALAGTTGDGFDPSQHRPKTSVVREAQGQYSFTQVHLVGKQGCLRCGWPLEEVWAVEGALVDGVRQRMGRMLVCSKCDKDSFMFTSHMPRTVERRRREEGKVVL